MSELPIIKRGRKKYYFDARLKQLRNVNNPHDFIDLTDAECIAISWKAKPQNLNPKLFG
jgi:hypothetical protein